MSRWYLDTSAALKLLVEEAESTALAQAIDDESPRLAASWLLETELRRASNRDPELTQHKVSEFLDGISLYEVPASLFREAGLLPGPNLRSLDALHLATAVRLGVDALVAYDLRLQSAARAVGVHVIAPA
ncbi:hypothetical protein BJY21_003079 [Kineosphaera limosa]|uniref:Ribonuclease VapC n=1 Tax=Kineosphaera limosa NBRC 100340 TaxID=1184609 RepID=K6WVI5_9MICO|nr:type II toxin-antitoxin system VapC family toxin [Kineosphaera limosa]NYE01895.1 hypothetical protein [Kineosphaera limosa]GAB96122.1 hypothetical protein KILIM_032_00070 [Kineosphaera limosa NBRC 100340]